MDLISELVVPLWTRKSINSIVRKPKSGCPAFSRDENKTIQV